MLVMVVNCDGSLRALKKLGKMQDSRVKMVRAESDANN